MIDKRVIERQIRKGKLDAAAYQRTLEGLPDLSDRVARDTGEEPSRSAVAAAPSAPSSAGYERAPESAELEDDEDDEGKGDDAAPEAPASY